MDSVDSNTPEILMRENRSAGLGVEAGGEGVTLGVDVPAKRSRTPWSRITMKSYG